MTRRTILVLGGVAVLAGAAGACSKAPAITAEVAGATSGTGTTMTVATGTGAAGPGGTTGSTGSGMGGASSGSGTSSSSSGGPAKVVTADNDIAQYQSITLTGSPSPLNVVSGPFFVTDVYASCQPGLSVVTGGDCTASTQTPVLLVSMTQENGPWQIHGIRLPVLAGQTLCASGLNCTATVLGFAPY